MKIIYYISLLQVYVHFINIILNFKIKSIRMSAFKKKSGVPDTISDLNKKMSLLLGGSEGQSASRKERGKISKDMILACAMFWDSKQRIDKIKGLILKQQQLEAFQDAEDFKVQDLESIELLSLSRNCIAYLQPLSCLTTLLCLNINYNKVYDISPLSKLLNLQQLYVSNNTIKTIQALQPLKKLRILNLYNNKIARLPETLQSLKQLQSLQELDIENNPVYEPANKPKFINLSNLSRFNGQLVLDQEKQDKIMSASCVVIPNAKFRDTHTSFWNSRSNQKQRDGRDGDRKQKECSQWSVSNRNMSYQQVIENLRQKSQELELQYLQIDDKFQTEIVRNVQLKSQIHNTLLQNKKIQREQQQAQQRSQQLKNLKRKVKALKQNLFNPQISGMPKNKCELLRQIFELQMIKQNRNNNGQPIKFENQKREVRLSNGLWVRKFDYDEEIIIGVPGAGGKMGRKEEKNMDQKYFMDEDDQIQQLLMSNTSAIEDLKKQLQELSRE